MRLQDDDRLIPPTPQADQFGPRKGRFEQQPDILEVAASWPVLRSKNDQFENHAISITNDDLLAASSQGDDGRLFTEDNGA